MVAVCGHCGSTETQACGERYPVLYLGVAARVLGQLCQVPRRSWDLARQPPAIHTNGAWAAELLEYEGGGWTLGMSRQGWVLRPDGVQGKHGRDVAPRGSCGGFAQPPWPVRCCPSSASTCTCPRSGKSPQQIACRPSERLRLLIRHPRLPREWGSPRRPRVRGPCQPEGSLPWAACGWPGGQRRPPWWAQVQPSHVPRLQPLRPQSGMGHWSHRTRRRRRCHRGGEWRPRTPALMGVATRCCGGDRRCGATRRCTERRWRPGASPAPQPQRR